MKTNKLLFNTIAPIYGLFYNMQEKRYKSVVGRISEKLNLTSYRTILDVGCGTGALCSVLNELGFAVTGMDPAEKMLKIAKRRHENQGISFIQASVLESPPFEDKSFDISIASYVAHGLQKKERKHMYAEMETTRK